jgi:hypothetical protein
MLGERMKKRSLVLIPMTLMMFSCEQMEAQKKSNPEITTQRGASESDIEYSAKLSRIGEILVNNPVGFAHANELFDRALKLDANNDKALFYSAFTGIYETLRGIGERARPMSDTPSEYEANLKKLTDYYKYPEFKEFIIGTKSSSVIKTYQDAKKFMQIEVDGALEAAVEKLEKIDSNVDMILTNLKTENSASETNCRTEEDEEGSYTTCDLNEEMNSINALPGTKRNVDLTDIKIIASGLRAQSVYLKLLTSYSIDGAKNLTNEIKVKELDLGRDLTDEETHTIVKRYPDFLRLESDNKMSKIISSLESIVEMGMDLDTLNNQFCDTDDRSNNLIKTICIGEAERESMKETLSYLSGPKEITLGFNAKGVEVKVLMDLPTYLGNPLQDLKSLITGLTYDDEGNNSVTIEPELNGLFPNKDLLKKLGQVVN